MNRIEPKLFLNGNSVDIKMINGSTESENGIENAIAISLLTENKNNEHHNLLMNRKSEKIGSKFYNACITLPLNRQGMIDRETAAKSDLKWLLDDDILSDLSVSVTAPNSNECKLTIQAKQKNGNYISFKIVESNRKFNMVQ
jgi:phage gp46-like protein